LKKPRLIFISLFLILLISACSLFSFSLPTVVATSGQTLAPSESVSEAPTQTQVSTETPNPSPTSAPLVPNFSHVVIIMFENKEFDSIIGNADLPVYNRYAQEYTTLTSFYAVTHPSLPNYLALIGGDTFGVTSNCNDCFVKAPTLTDEIENSGRTWKAYEEDFPMNCFLGDSGTYAQKHDPFIYFDSIRLNADRCNQDIVQLSQLKDDITNGNLPNFIFITPNLCHDAHDCGVNELDAWLKGQMDNLIPALDQLNQPYLIVLTWDEGETNVSCCSLPQDAGGRIATVLISPQVKKNFNDDTPFTHYSLLKTIEVAWDLPLLGHSADDNNLLITAPWQ
jgi:phospholipase C